jgi:hypothetical protein
MDADEEFPMTHKNYLPAEYAEKRRNESKAMPIFIFSSASFCVFCGQVRIRLRLCR